MPAFQLSRLKTQIGELMRFFTQPEKFHSKLTDLLEFYADHGYKAGEVVQTPIIISAYRIPPLVLKHLELEMSHLNRENPHAGLTLADELWTNKYLEPRLLAAKLLGETPIELKDQVVKRLSAWAQPGIEEPFLDNLISIGGKRLRHEHDPTWMELMEGWLVEKNTEQKKIGLRAVALTIQDQEYKNIPPVFRLITPVVQESAQVLQSSILEILECLAKRTPLETVYFIRKQVENPQTSSTAKTLLRQCLPFFSTENRSLLRDLF